MIIFDHKRVVGVRQMIIESGSWIYIFGERGLVQYEHMIINVGQVIA